MKLSEETLNGILSFAAKFGIEAATIFLKNINTPEPTIDHAIAALEAAGEKSLQQIIDETPTPPAP